EFLGKEAIRGISIQGATLHRLEPLPVGDGSIKGMRQVDPGFLCEGGVERPEAWLRCASMGSETSRKHEADEHGKRPSTSGHTFLLCVARWLSRCAGMPKDIRRRDNTLGTCARALYGTSAHEATGPLLLVTAVVTSSPDAHILCTRL